jgi:hypothetical protein
MTKFQFPNWAISASVAFSPSESSSRPLIPALWPRNARNGSITLHHDQYPVTVSFKTASTTERTQTSRTPWPESDALVCCSCRLALIVFQQAAQPLPAPHLFLFSTDCLSRHREYHSIALSLRSWPQFVPCGEREMEKQRIAQTLKSHGIVAYQSLFILLSGGTWTDFFRRYLVLCSRLAQLASLACNICSGSLV